MIKKSVVKNNDKMTIMSYLKLNPSSFDGNKLALTNCGIYSIGKVPIGITSRINVLYLGNNFLTTLNGIESFSNLTILTLSDNNITYLDCIDCLKLLPNLQKLTLQGNNISLIPFYREIVINFCQSLQQLDGKKITNDEKILSNKIITRINTIFSQLQLNELHLAVLKQLLNLRKSHLDMRKHIFPKFRSMTGDHIALNESNISIGNSYLYGTSDITKITKVTLAGGVYRLLLISSRQSFHRTSQNLLRSFHSRYLQVMTTKEKLFFSTSDKARENYWNDLISECIQYQQLNIISTIDEIEKIIPTHNQSLNIQEVLSNQIKVLDFIDTSNESGLQSNIHMYGCGVGNICGSKYGITINLTNDKEISNKPKNESYEINPTIKKAVNEASNINTISKSSDKLNQSYNLLNKSIDPVDILRSSLTNHLPPQQIEPDIYTHHNDKFIDENKPNNIGNRVTSTSYNKNDTVKKKDDISNKIYSNTNTATINHIIPLTDLTDDFSNVLMKDYSYDDANIHQFNDHMNSNLHAFKEDVNEPNILISHKINYSALTLNDLLIKYNDRVNDFSKYLTTASDSINDIWLLDELETTFNSFMSPISIPVPVEYDATQIQSPSNMSTLKKEVEQNIQKVTITQRDVFISFKIYQSLEKGVDNISNYLINKCNDTYKINEYLVIILNDIDEIYTTIDNQVTHGENGSDKLNLCKQLIDEQTADFINQIDVLEDTQNKITSINSSNNSLKKSLQEVDTAITGIYNELKKYKQLEKINKAAHRNRIKRKWYLTKKYYYILYNNIIGRKYMRNSIKNIYTKSCYRLITKIFSIWKSNYYLKIKVKTIISEYKSHYIKMFVNKWVAYTGKRKQWNRLIIHWNKKFWFYHFNKWYNHFTNQRLLNYQITITSNYMITFKIFHNWLKLFHLNASLYNNYDPIKLSIANSKYTNTIYRKIFVSWLMFTRIRNKNLHITLSYLTKQLTRKYFINWINIYNQVKIVRCVIKKRCLHKLFNYMKSNQIYKKINVGVNKSVYKPLFNRLYNYYKKNHHANSINRRFIDPSIKLLNKYINKWHIYKTHQTKIRNNCLKAMTYSIDRLYSIHWNIFLSNIKGIINAKKSIFDLTNAISRDNDCDLDNELVCHPIVTFYIPSSLDTVTSDEYCDLTEAAVSNNDDSIQIYKIYFSSWLNVQKSNKRENHLVVTISLKWNSYHLSKAFNQIKCYYIKSLRKSVYLRNGLINSTIKENDKKLKSSQQENEELRRQTIEYLQQLTEKTFQNDDINNKLEIKQIELNDTMYSNNLLTKSIDLLQEELDNLNNTMYVINQLTIKQINKKQEIIDNQIIMKENINMKINELDIQLAELDSRQRAIESDYKQKIENLLNQIKDFDSKTCLLLESVESLDKQIQSLQSNRMEITQVLEINTLRLRRLTDEMTREINCKDNELNQLIKQENIVVSKYNNTKSQIDLLSNTLFEINSYNNDNSKGKDMERISLLSNSIDLNINNALTTIQSHKENINKSNNNILFNINDYINDNDYNTSVYISGNVISDEILSQNELDDFDEMESIIKDRIKERLITTNK